MVQGLPSRFFLKFCLTLNKSYTQAKTVKQSLYWSDCAADQEHKPTSFVASLTIVAKDERKWVHRGILFFVSCRKNIVVTILKARGFFVVVVVVLVENFITMAQLSNA